MNTPLDASDQRIAWFQALRDKDFSTAQDLLDNGVDIEELSARWETAFLMFAGQGLREQAQWLIERGANPNATDGTGQNALHLIVRRGAAEEIEDAVKWGVDINHQDGRGTTPLLLATVSERHAYDLVKALLEHKPDPNIAAKSTTTAVLAAAAGKDLRPMKLLLDAGADYKALGVRGSLLHSLLESEAKDAEEVTVEVINRFPDLDVNQLSRAGSTPLAFAVSRGARGAIKALLKAGADPNARAVSKLGSRMSALMMLATGPCDPEAYELCFAKGADTEVRDENGFTALAYALVAGPSEAEVKMVSAMEQQLGDKPSQEDIKNLQKALEEMIWARRQENIDALLAGGASPTAPLSGDGRSAYHTALQFADKEQRLEAIRWLASRGFAVNPGRATLSFPPPKEEWADDVAELVMLRFHDEEAIEELLAAGLDPAKPNEKEGITLLHSVGKVGLLSKEQAAIGMIQRKIFNMTNEDDKAKEAKEKLEEQVKELVDQLNVWRTAMFNRLVEAAGTPDAPDARGLTPLAYFIAHGVTPLAEAALAAGADPLHMDEDGDHVVSVAAKVGNIEWMHRLLTRLGPHHEGLQNLFIDLTLGSPEAGSRAGFINVMRTLTQVEGGVAHWLNMRDEHGNTPLIMAAATKQEDLVDVFLAMGADPNLAANDGNTALHHAVDQERGDIAKNLIAAGADREARNKLGKNAYDIALTKGSPYVNRMLREEDAPKPTIELDEETVKLVQQAQEKGREGVKPTSSRRPLM